MPQQHLIHRQILNLCLANAQDATDKQHQAAQIFHNSLLKVMEEVFDEYVPNDRNWRIDKLEIDLGHLDLQNAEEWQTVLRERLMATLLDFKKKEYAGNRLILNDLDTFVYFLKTGQLPWWSPATSVFDPSEKLISLVQQEPERLRIVLKALLVENGKITGGRIFERLMQQCSEQSLKILVNVLAVSASSLVNLGKMVIEMLLFFIENPKKQLLLVATFSEETVVILEKYLLKFYIEAVLMADTEGEQLAVLWRNISHIFYQLEDSKAFMLYFESEYTKRLGLSFPFEITQNWGKNKEHVEILGENKADKQTQPRPTIRQAISNNELLITQNEQRITSNEQNTAHNEHQLITNTPIINNQPDALFIQNAGLILIAPFFRPVFQSLGYLDKKVFKDVETQKRAVLLTQYLVTKTTELQEYQLVLNKILCGYPLEETLPMIFEPTDEEQKACAELYETITENWGAMRRTTEGVFRSSFLQRLGKLQKREADNAWQLNVERQSIDILFETLPPKWSFAFVKLPWIASPIWTEW